MTASVQASTQHRMFFSWFKKRRRQRLLREEFPREWLDYLEHWAPFYHQLESADQEKLRDDVRLFIAERYWEGCNGLSVTDEMKVAIAAYACLLVLRQSVDTYQRLQTILIYPEQYLAMKSTFPRAEPSVVGWRHGESWADGCVILTWDEIVENRRNDGGGNLVLHELAHQLDMQDQFADGVPQLGSPAQYEAWQQTMQNEFRQLNEDADAGRPTLLDYYGTKDRAEFFAVSTECFFMRSAELAVRHAGLYQMLAEYYQQDPAKW